MEKQDSRFPARVYRHGSEPDARFSLANERTFLAWLRTSLALIAGGVALETLGLGINPPHRLAASLILIVCGILAPLQAWLGWVATERSLRLNKPLPHALLALPLAVAVLAVGVLLFIGVLTA
ncbi:DUF202 domain-containing protein [Dermabacteraceae bacterium TAE3-ERU5]|nr:DUF202 domain-containing protein [Dermabacteraceae bacterium TAE3-ERU27]MBV7432596.1 DUF202 domain-containing protein [Dermabacteraceae bacterium TAE3-ERU5]